MSTLRDILGFSVIWVPLFGMPLLLVGYVAYLVATRKIRPGGAESEEEQSSSRSSNRKKAA